MGLDLNKLDKQITDALDKMTDDDWKDYKNKSLQTSLRQGFITTEKVETEFFILDDFKWEINDLYYVMEEVDDGNTKVTDVKLEKFLIKFKVIKPYLGHHKPDDNFYIFMDHLRDLIYNK